MSYISISIRTAVLAAIVAAVVGLLGALSSGVSAQARVPDPTPCPTALTTVTPTPLPTLIGGATQSPTPTPAGQTPAPGNPPQCLGPIKVPTTALIGGAGGATLTFECKWEAPDMTPYDTAMDYGSVGHRDDTPWVTADGPPCDPSAPATDNRHHMVGIVANAENKPIQRQYEKWVAIQSADITAISDVYFKVWEPYVTTPPNGPNCGAGATPPLDQVPVEAFPSGSENFFCLEEQHHATADQGPPTPTNPLISVPCTALQGPAYTNMFAQAVENGAMTQAEVNNIINQCFQGLKAIYRVPDLLTKDKPCGEVRIEATAVNSVGTAFHLVNYMDNICFIHLQVDFNKVDWQTISANGSAVIPGDMIFDPAGTTACPTAPVGCENPTVLNTGNAPMYVETMFDPLILASDPTKKISSFDSKLRASWQTNPANLEIADPQAANTWYCFGNEPIGHDQTGKLDLSVHPVNAQAGTYNGSVYVVARFDCNSPHTGFHPNSAAGGH